MYLVTKRFCRAQIKSSTGFKPKKNYTNQMTMYLHIRSMRTVQIVFFDYDYYYETLYSLHREKNSSFSAATSSNFVPYW